MHLATFVNILPNYDTLRVKIIYKLVTRVIQYFRFPDRPMKGGVILDFEKGGGILEKRGGYDPPYQLWQYLAKGSVSSKYRVESESKK